MRLEIPHRRRMLGNRWWSDIGGRGLAMDSSPARKVREAQYGENTSAQAKVEGRPARSVCACRRLRDFVVALLAGRSAGRSRTNRARRSAADPDDGSFRKARSTGSPPRCAEEEWRDSCADARRATDNAAVRRPAVTEHAAAEPSASDSFIDDAVTAANSSRRGA